VSTEPWNHNLHYHPLLLAWVPIPCSAALDVGCGDGVFTRKLSEQTKETIGIDRSHEMIGIARRSAGALQNVTFVEGDFLDYPLSEASFDFIVAIAVIHHMPLEVALRRMSDLLRPGGVLAVLGLGRAGSIIDVFIRAPAIPANWLLRIRKGWWNSPAPVTQPLMTYSEIKQVARAVLPGAVVRRRLFFRYSLRWRKPSLA
jgi:ubiquinone/menaquinone biosynthesis C-methylase UbiE